MKSGIVGGYVGVPCILAVAYGKLAAISPPVAESPLEGRPMRVYRRKLPDGTLTPTFYVEYRHEGKHIIKSTGCTTEREAQSVARDLVAPLRQETSARALVETHRVLLSGAAPIPLADAWRAFAAKPRAQAVSERQRENNRARWSDFVAYMAGEYPAAKTLAAVKRAHAEAYLQHLRTLGRYAPETTYRRGRREVHSRAKGPRLLAPRSLNALHDTCKMVFSTLALDAGLADNPFAGIDRAKVTYEARDAFTIAEVRALVDTADAFLQPLVMCAASTGMRLGDCATLRWSDVDFSAGMIVRAAHKTGAPVRIPLLPGFRRYLEARRAAPVPAPTPAPAPAPAPAGNAGHAPAPAAPVAPAAPPPPDYCFPEQARMYQTNPDGLSYRMKALLAKATPKTAATVKVEGRTRAVSRRDFHSLRHSFLTLAACANVPPHLLQQLAGHATPTMTARYTAHENDDLLKDRLAAMPDPLALPAPADATPSPAELLAKVRARLAAEKRPSALARDLRAMLEARP